MDKVVKQYENGESFYLYTGRGPSSSRAVAPVANPPSGRPLPPRVGPSRRAGQQLGGEQGEWVWLDGQEVWRPRVSNAPTSGGATVSANPPPDSHDSVSTVSEARVHAPPSPLVDLFGDLDPPPDQA